MGRVVTHTVLHSTNPILSKLNNTFVVSTTITLAIVRVSSRWPWRHA